MLCHIYNCHMYSATLTGRINKYINKHLFKFENIK